MVLKRLIFTKEIHHKLSDPSISIIKLNVSTEHFQDAESVAISAY